MSTGLRSKLSAFDLEQNPAAVRTLKPLVENLGQQYFLTFFPHIVQQTNTDNETPLEDCCNRDVSYYDDAVSDVRLACCNGRKCRGTAFLPRGQFRMAVFMCEKRWSNRDPEDPLAKKATHTNGKFSSTHSDCFERCICLACAVHSLVTLLLSFCGITPHWSLTYSIC